MVVQSTPIPTTPYNLTLLLPNSPSFASGFHYFTPFQSSNTIKYSIKCSSFSKVYTYGTIDFEKRPMLKWSNVFQKISLMENPQMGASFVLNQCEKDGKNFSKWELSKIIKQLRKFGKFKLALEVYEWINNRPERFRFTSSDQAIQLDLIAKVHGVSRAEHYLLRMPDYMKDNRIYGALLNAYVGAGVRDRAESLMEQMRNKGYTTHALPFNVMMTLYMKLKVYDKVNELLSEMNQRGVRLDLYTYNIWLSACGSQGCVEEMEHVFEKMKLDPNINPNWTTYSTIASIYVKFGQPEKAEQYLKNLELRITGRDRMPYHYLINLYGSLGNKEEVYRVWNVYKSSFPRILNWGYHNMITSLIKLGDIEGAEKIYEEWLGVKSAYDPRVGNLLMGWYVKEEPFEKAKSFFDHMVEVGKLSPGSWEILGEGHVKEGRISEALSCFKEAVSIDGRKTWRPKPSNVSAFMELCEKEGDVASKEDFAGLLRQLSLYEEGTYGPLGGPNDGEVTDDTEHLMSINRSDIDDDKEETDSEESGMLFSTSG